MATEIEVIQAVERDPAQLAAAMAQLKLAVVTLRLQLKGTSTEGTGPRAIAPKPEARAAIREKARTGSLKPVRTAVASTGQVGPRNTGRVELAVSSPGQGLEAVEGWESLGELAAQNEAKPRTGRMK